MIEFVRVPDFVSNSGDGIPVFEDVSTDCPVFHEKVQGFFRDPVPHVLAVVIHQTGIYKDIGRAPEFILVQKVFVYHP